ncbi:MAG TPA: hypothetical protein VF604_06085 [Pyrinomonadaceae bacterium]|jgi:hypothetical protein
MDSQRNKAVRLTFVFEDDNIELISQQPVEMIPPPSDEIRHSHDAIGSWLELKSEGEKPLYRQLLQNFIRYDREVFSQNEQESVTRVPVERPEGAFTVVIPDIAEAQSVSLFSSPDNSSLESMLATPAREIKSFRLTYK